MTTSHTNRPARLAALAAVLASALSLFAQQSVILNADEAAKLVPKDFFFEGQLAPTQMRNAAALRLGSQRHVIAALVDTSGYASNIRDKYEGFLISEVPVMIGGTEVKPGAYGFGFSESGKMNIMDVGGNILYAVAAGRDDKLQSPRPLAIIQSGKDLKLYRGKSFVTVAAK
jgi:hypothetical protein